jgi:ribonuclease J
LATLKGIALELIIHKGSQEIGGTCIQLSHASSTILLDVGLPLAEDSIPVDAKNIHTDAVLISHPHQDHFGLIETIDESVPVYCGELSRELMDAARLFTGRETLRNNFKYFKAWEPFTVGSFRVTPYLVDHSAPDAYGFLVEAGGVRVFYSGDFRAHGRKSILFDRILADPPSNIDVLFMEGTMLRRSNSDFKDEEEVQETIEQTISNQESITFLICSSQNIDRMVSAFKACYNHDKTLVVDVYTAWVLEKLKLSSKRVPNISWGPVKVYVSGKQYKVIQSDRARFGDFVGEVFDDDNRVLPEELHEHPADFLYVAKLSSFPIIRKHIEKGPVNIIYSQWTGYLEKENWASYGARETAEFCDNPQVDFIYAHTSGHAILEDLKRFAAAMNPGKLIPIHTEYRDEFKEHFDNVFEVDDEQQLAL